MLFALQAYVAGDTDENAVKATEVVTEAQIEQEEKVEQSRLLRRGMCIFCILIIAIVVPISIVVPGGNETEIIELSEAPSLAPSSSPTGAVFFSLIQNLQIMYQDTEEYDKAFSDPTSPQLRAAEWASYEDPHGLSGDDPRMISRYALAAFYFATKGDDWDRCGRDSTNCDAENEWLTAPNECDWLAIECHEGGFSIKDIFFGTFFVLEMRVQFGAVAHPLSLSMQFTRETSSATILMERCLLI